MKKAMLYVLALCICLTMAGCRREVLPAGEVDESQAGMEANAPIDCSDAPLDSTEMESSAEPDDGEDPVSSDASGEVSVVAPSVVSDVATETEPPSSLPAASADPGESAGESAAPPVISTVSLPASYFTPPDLNRLYKRSESTLERLINWINSEEALTEEGGVYREAVEYYRERGYLFYPAFVGEAPELSWISFRADGCVAVTYDEEGTVWYTPMSESEAAAGGIVPYLESKGHTMTPNATAPQPGQKYPSSVWGVGCIETWTPKQVQLANGLMDAVLRVYAFELDGDDFHGYPCALHWLEGGFHVRYTTTVMDPIIAYSPDQVILPKLYMTNVPLNNTAS